MPAPFQFIIQNTISIFIYYKFRMTNLISLHSPGDLLEIDGNTINYLIVCEHAKMAKQFLETIISENKGQQIQGQSQDNIIRISIKNSSTIAHITDEVEKVRILKCLLLQISDMDKDKQAAKKFSEGFFYYNQHIKSLCFFKLRKLSCQKIKPEKIKIRSCMQIFGILGFMLNYCCTSKQYLSYWNKVFLKNQQFKPEYKGEMKVDVFIKKALSKQIPTLKIADHQLEIISETANWVRNKMPATPEKKNKNNKQNLNGYTQFKYSDLMKIDLKNRNDTPARLKHSSSMTSLASNKNRKYKKAPQHFKDFKSKKSSNKEQMPIATESFWHNTKTIASHSKTFKPSTLLASTKISTNDNWYRQDLREQSTMKFPSKIKQNDSQKIVTDQLDLLKLLQKKQNKRNATNYQSKSILYDITTKQGKNQRANLQTIDRSFTKVLNICSSNIQICIRPSKKHQNMKMCTSLYSLNQSMQSPKNKIQNDKTNLSEINLSQIVNKQPQNIQRRKKSNKYNNYAEVENCGQQIKYIQQQKNIEQKQTKIAVVQNQAQTALDKNIKFLYDFCMFANENRREFTLKRIIISFYSLYLYYFIIIRKRNLDVKAHASHEINLEKILGQFNQFRNKGQHKHHSNSIIQFISQINIKKVQQITSNQQENIKQVIIKTLKIQFQHRKEQIIKNCPELQQKDNNELYKLFHIFLLRLAISISLIQRIEKQSDAVSDFPGHEKKIRDKTDVNYTNLRNQLSQYQYLF